MISGLTPLEFLARSGSVYRDCVAVVDDRRVTLDCTRFALFALIRGQSLS